LSVRIILISFVLEMVKYVFFFYFSNKLPFYRSTFAKRFNFRKEKSLVHSMLTMLVTMSLSINHECLISGFSFSDAAGECSQLPNNLQFLI